MESTDSRPSEPGYSYTDDFELESRESFELEHGESQELGPVEQPVSSSATQSSHNNEALETTWQVVQPSASENGELHDLTQSEQPHKQSLGKPTSDEEHVKQKRGPMKFVNIEQCKAALSEKFESVADAYVFFDILSSGYVTYTQFKRALVRIGLQHLGSDRFFQEVKWKCVDGQRVFEREFFDLFQWHETEDRSQDLTRARRRRERNLKDEHNKAIGSKGKVDPRPTPECDKLRAILQEKFQSIADFMVALDMDLTDVSTPSHLRVGFKRLAINNVSAEVVVKELEEPALPPGMARNSSFSKVLKWAPIDDLHEELTRARLKLTHQRASLELTNLPAVRHNIREGSVTKAFRNLLRHHFGSVLDAFVFFDLDCSTELNRSKVLHGLGRLKQMANEEDPTVVGEELVRELHLGKDSSMSVSEFVSRMKWHKVQYGTDLDQLVFDARKKMKQHSAMTASSLRPRPPKNHFPQHRFSPRQGAQKSTASKHETQSPRSNRVVTESRSASFPKESPERSAAPEGSELPAECANEGEETPQETVSVGGSTQPPAQEDNADSPPPAIAPTAAGSGVEPEAAGQESHRSTEKPGGMAKAPGEPRGVQEGQEGRKGAGRSKRSKASGRQRGQKASAPAAGRGAERGAELAWLDETTRKTLDESLRKSLQREFAPRPARDLWAWGGAGRTAAGGDGGRQGVQAARKREGAVRELVLALRERGFEDMVEAFVFVDSAGAGRVSLSQVQRGLVRLRIFGVSVHDLPIRFGGQRAAAPTIAVAQFLAALAEAGEEEAALHRLTEAEKEERRAAAARRREEIVARALGGVGSVADRRVDELRSRLMQGLSVEESPGRREAEEGSSEAGRAEHGAEGGRGVQAQAVTAGKVEIRPVSHADGEPRGSSSSSSERGGGASAGAYSDDFGEEEGPGSPSGSRAQPDSAPRREAEGEAAAEERSARAPAERAGRVEAGAKARMMREKEGCAPLLELLAASSHEALRKEAVAAGGANAGEGEGEVAAEAVEAAEGVPAPAKAKYIHARRHGQAFRISAEAGEAPEGAARAWTGPPAGWTGRALYRKLRGDDGRALVLESVVGRLRAAGLERGRLGMLVTRLCEQSEGREAEEEEEGITEDMFVAAFEDMEGAWQREAVAPADDPPAAAVGTRQARRVSISNATAGGKGEADSSPWAHFDDGLDEDEAEDSGQGLGVLETLAAQRVVEREHFERIDLGGGNWFEGQASKSRVPHGVGLLVFAPGDSLGRRWQLGTFRRGQLEGPGVQVQWDGGFYLGDFKGGRRHGAGVDGMVNAVVYEGEFRDGRKDGVGCVWVETGPAFFGEWVLGDRHGRGVTGSCNRAWLRDSVATWPSEAEGDGEQGVRRGLPHSEIRTAIKFEEWVLVSSGVVATASRHLPKGERDQTLEALLWNSAQARTAACEGWSHGEAILRRMHKFIHMREAVQRNGTELRGRDGPVEGRGPKRVLLPVATRFKRKETPFLIPHIPIFNAITRHKPI